ncbi:MAG TPA: tagaturonate epimerase family protein [Thermodesulfobacteriota bacterium]|nr:tagaturonate epimerase family protein [Thermodesulfobacteriota bacterium]
MRKTELTQTKKIQKLLKPFPITLLKVYPKSFCSRDGLTCGLVRIPKGKRLVVLGVRGGVRKDPFKGKTYHRDETALKVCDFSPENTACLMALFPFTKPVSLRKYPITVGTGDRLGMATPGHLRAVRKFSVRPVLAQQSVRENKQTGRNFLQVVRDAAWAVFQESYPLGYGADGDHLKTFDEIQEALEVGVSMVTLDLTEKLNPSAFADSTEEMDQTFKNKINAEESKVLFHLFLNKEFRFSGPQGRFSIQFNEESVKRNILLFHKAIDFTDEVYQFILSRLGNQRTIDFEISIDETPFSTSPENHLFFIIALNQRGVRIDSLAPRFIGEFQKAIDYRGNLGEFRKQFYQHAMIAKDYGNYKISIHSGSDKFSVFPSMGELAANGLHLKTAGTSWLEAMRLVSRKFPSLYREMHQYALSIFNEATQLYYVTTDLGKIPNLEGMKDKDLPRLMDQEDARQLIHLTYGYLLNAKGKNGKYLFRERFFQTLTDDEEEYWTLLEKHIGKHLTSLGLKKVEREG